MCMQAVTKLGDWVRQGKLHILALSRAPVTLPLHLEVLGPKSRYTCNYMRNPIQSPAANLLL